MASKSGTWSEVLFWQLAGGTKESHENSEQIIRSISRDLNPTHPDSVATVCSKCVDVESEGWFSDEVDGSHFSVFSPSVETVVLVCVWEKSQYRFSRRVTKCFNATQPEILRNFYLATPLRHIAFSWEESTQRFSLLSDKTWQENCY
jgi:hypothetical protein